MFINTASLSAKLTWIKIIHKCSCFNSFELESYEAKPNHNGTSEEGPKQLGTSMIDLFLSFWLGLLSWAQDLQGFFSSIQWFTDN